MEVTPGFFFWRQYVFDYFDFEPRRITAINTGELMVAGQLRVANVIPSHREYMFSSTPSEPIKGQRGKLAARLVLTLALDAALGYNYRQATTISETDRALHLYISSHFFLLCLLNPRWKYHGNLPGQPTYRTNGRGIFQGRLHHIHTLRESSR
jgi:hypothetical protein